MNKATALEEMYLIYQAVRNYLADSEPWWEFGVEDLVPSYHSFCQRGLLVGCSWSLCWKESMDRAKECSGYYN